MKTNKNYVSPIDEKLAEFDQSHPKSASQQAEIAKHLHIQTLRDKPISKKQNPNKLWD